MAVFNKDIILFEFFYLPILKIGFYEFSTDITSDIDFISKPKPNLLAILTLFQNLNLNLEKVSFHLNLNSITFTISFKFHFRLGTMRSTNSRLYASLNADTS